MLGDFLFKPPQNNPFVEIATPFMGNGQVGVETFVCNSNSYDVAVVRSPSWTVTQKLWVLSLKVNGDFFDVRGSGWQVVYRHPLCLHPKDRLL